MAASKSQVPVLVIASTFYTPALEKPFADRRLRENPEPELLCVPYNQLSGFLLNPASMLEIGVPARAVVIIRLEDLIRPELAAGTTTAEALTSILRERVEQLTVSLLRSQLDLAVLICPSGRGCYKVEGLANVLRIVEHKLSAALRLCQRHLVVDWFEWPELERGIKTGEWLNIPGDRLGHVPFTPKGLESLATYFMERRGDLPVSSLKPDRASSDALALEKFLGSLQLEFKVAPMTAADEQPIVDLVRHTTHFVNLADRKWDTKLLQDLRRDSESWVVRVRDRFGDYGLSGAVTFGREDDTMNVGFLFLTCPVLGKQVEHTLFSWLAEIAAGRKVVSIAVPFTRGRDNEGLCRFLGVLSGSNEAAMKLGSETTFRIPVSGMQDRVSRSAVNPAAVTEVLSAMSAGSAA